MNRTYTPKFDRKSYYEDLIENHNHPIKQTKHVGRYKNVMKCLYCGTLGTEWKYKNYLKLYCNDDCKLNYRVKFAIDNNLKTTSKRRNNKEIKNDFSLSIRRKIFEHDLLKPNKELIKLAIDKFITDIKNVDYLCKKCLRTVELKKNLRTKYLNSNKSFGYNVELSHIKHNPYENNIKFDDDFNIISKSVEFICSNCHSLEYTHPIKETEVK